MLIALLKYLSRSTCWFPCLFARIDRSCSSSDTFISLFELETEQNWKKYSSDVRLLDHIECTYSGEVGRYVIASSSPSKPYMHRWLHSNTTHTHINTFTDIPSRVNRHRVQIRVHYKCFYRYEARFPSYKFFLNLLRSFNLNWMNMMTLSRTCVIKFW